MKSMALNGKAVVFMHNLVGLNFLIVPQTQDSVQVLLNQFNFYGQHYVTNAFRLILGGKKKIRNRGYGVMHLQFK